MLAPRISSNRGMQAKEHDIYDVAPFTRSKVFTNNGYKVRDGAIEKRFLVNPETA